MHELNNGKIIRKGNRAQMSTNKLTSWVDAIAISEIASKKRVSDGICQGFETEGNLHQRDPTIFHNEQQSHACLQAVLSASSSETILKSLAQGWI